MGNEDGPNLFNEFLNSDVGRGEVKRVLLEHSQMVREVVEAEEYRKAIAELMDVWRHARHDQVIFHGGADEKKELVRVEQEAYDAVLDRIVHKLQSCNGDVEHIRRWIEIASSTAFATTVKKGASIDEIFKQDMMFDIAVRGFMPRKKEDKKS